jgi:hypothetical protein
VPATHNLGALHLVPMKLTIHYLFFSFFVPGDANAKRVARGRYAYSELRKNLVGASCVNGSLFVDSPPAAEFDTNLVYMVIPVWRFAMFPGSNLHPYEYVLCL